MGWWQRFKRADGVKQMTPSYIRTMLMRGTAHWSAFDFVAFVQEGYSRNPTVYACIAAKAQAASDLPIILTDAQGQPIEKHPLLDMIKQPNIYQSWSSLMTELISNYCIAGDAPLLKIAAGRKVELIGLRPDQLIIETYDRASGLPSIMRYSSTDANQATVSRQYDAKEVLIWHEYNPLDRWRGLSPLRSCAYAIDTLNSYASSNKATLDNGVTPSGVLATEQKLDDPTFNRLKDQFDTRYAGASNSGKPMILEGGLSWTQTGLSPREMEYIQGKRANELDICKALRVPPQIIGIDGSQTFANYEQARAALYEDEVIPMVNSLLSEIVRFVSPELKTDGYTLRVDVDAVTALEPRRAERNKTVDALQSITINEKRAAMGYEGVGDEGDLVLVSSGVIPLDMAGVDPVTSTGN